MKKFISKISFIVIAFLAVVSITSAITMELSEKESKSIFQEEMLGGEINLIEEETTSSASVGTTTTEIVASNAARKYLVLTNDSDEVVYITFGDDAVLNKGIRLNASGGAYEMLSENLSFKAINGISTSGSKVVTFVEGY